MSYPALIQQIDKLSKKYGFERHKMRFISGISDAETLTAERKLSHADAEGLIQQHGINGIWLAWLTDDGLLIEDECFKYIDELLATPSYAEEWFDLVNGHEEIQKKEAQGLGK
ncbi:hypothetical protein PsalMR5_03313 [Piscirickettsia salmonis]|uniref:hypothetical protein n=1 Tax=Piscirickettsia salmonis TaxID=1238 RepID=UPI0012BA6796|nr:hypothetical protein [Piscirickettsia salmonis]QGP55844.1 hypothetical protein PsalSR1_03308 [Piscirickettsia salmonis]QGP58288.1 hypothetical protein PsalBI1_00849 [Piscirickettsia salmonis]QGP65413.1 hypothetical protein PsalMR5_03313 [Piscirickettsia salmonis]